MPKAELSELLFIAILFVVIAIISTVSIYLFVRQYKREKQANEEAKLKAKEAKVDPNSDSEPET